MDILEDMRRKFERAEDAFRKKKILFIGSESYDAAAITVLQGLHDLGFTICTIRKWNINSWFCNVVIDNPASHSFDFILSNEHWGTRWKYYNRYQLSSYPKVLVDGDDNRGWPTWLDKVRHHEREYVLEPAEEIKQMEIAPYRWVEDLDGYLPDVVFTAQKQLGDRSSFYLPFGIQNEYLTLNESKAFRRRTIDIAHIAGPGTKRRWTQRLIMAGSRLGVIPGNVFNGFARGEKTIAPQIKRFFEEENASKEPVHGYVRWTADKEYYRVLNNSKVLVYPGVSSQPFWDSKRPWEGYACGCLVLLSLPNIDVSDFPPTELEEFANYSGPLELISKCRFLVKNPEAAERYRVHAVERALKYFSAASIARYVLGKIADAR